VRQHQVRDDAATRRSLRRKRRAPLRSGLFCSYSYAAARGSADQQGVCNLQSKICPLFFSPVCGCDGITYGNTCQAGSAGTSLARVGGCDVNVAGAWKYINGAHCDYSFAADGTFSSEMTPVCRFTPSYCAVLTRERTGNYHIYDSNLSSTTATARRPASPSRSGTSRAAITT
jgi:hypothetical protein